MLRYTTVLLAACIMFAAGCVSIPVKTPTQDIRQDELKQDVCFLAQPALKGRKAGSWESPVVRRFLVQRFKQYGLRSWAGCESYEQDFRFGTNVIGVLPGSDPNLADQIVLVSAHYDHLGVQKWKVYPGAGDNASGVAAMLEIVESLSLSEIKPKRTICFASFDADEMGCLGSVAFTCRKDYDDSKIVAVVNMDILGRNLLEAVKNSLFLVGTEKYPEMQHQIMDFGKQADLSILPVSNSLVGPVGDHAAFISQKRPVLFLTSGIYNDYHEPTDTPDKINFGLLEKETTAVKQTVQLLADASRINPPQTGDGNDQQLLSLLAILRQIQDNQRIFNLDPNSTTQLNKLVGQTQEKVSGNPSSLNSVTFQRETITQLLNLLKTHNSILAQYSQAYLDISRYYALSPQAFTDAYRQVIRHFIEKGLPVFGGRYAYYKIAPITEQDWIVHKSQGDEFTFAAVKPQVGIRAQLSLLGKKKISLEMGSELYYCRVTQGRLEEYLFLQALRCNPAYVIERFSIIVSEKDIKTDLSKIGEPNEKAQQWLDILAKFQKRYPDPNSNSLIQKDLRWQGADLKNWLLMSMASDNTEIAKTAISFVPKLLGEPAEKILRQRLTDSSVPIDIRKYALYALAGDKKENLLSVAQVLDDKTPCPVAYAEILEADYPLKDHPLITETMTIFKEWYDKQKPKILGQVAAEQLTKMTKKNFGSDKKTWEQWIEKHYKQQICPNAHMK